MGEGTPLVAAKKQITYTGDKDNCQSVYLIFVYKIDTPIEKVCTFELKGDEDFFLDVRVFVNKNA